MNTKVKVVIFVFALVLALFAMQLISTQYARMRKKESYLNVERFSTPATTTSSADPRVQMIDAVDATAITESEKSTLLQQVFKKFEDLTEATPDKIKDFVRAGAALLRPVGTKEAFDGTSCVDLVAKVALLTIQSDALMKTIAEMRQLTQVTATPTPMPAAPVLPHHVSIGTTLTAMTPPPTRPFPSGSSVADGKIEGFENVGHRSAYSALD